MLVGEPGAAFPSGESATVTASANAFPGCTAASAKPHHPTPPGTNSYRTSHTGSPRAPRRSISSHAIALTTPATPSGTHDVPGVTGE